MSGTPRVTNGSRQKLGTSHRCLPNKFIRTLECCMPKFPDKQSSAARQCWCTGRPMTEMGNWSQLAGLKTCKF